MSDGHEYERKLTELAAAQLIEQLKNMQTTELELPINDGSSQWLVTVRRVETESGQ